MEGGDCLARKRRRQGSLRKVNREEVRFILDLEVGSSLFVIYLFYIFIHESNAFPDHRTTGITKCLCVSNFPPTRHQVSVNPERVVLGTNQLQLQQIGGLITFKYRLAFACIVHVQVLRAE